MAGPNLKGSPQSSSSSRSDTARIAAINLTPLLEKPRLLDQVRQAIRTRHYSPRTEETYVHWIKRFIFFHNKRHPAEMGEKDIARFLPSLASEQHVSASTQNQALNAILFLYRHVVRKDIGYVDGPVCDQRTQQAPPSVSVRATILALARFGIVAAAEVKSLEKRWAKHRKENSLDRNGKLSEALSTASAPHGPDCQSHDPTL